MRVDKWYFFGIVRRSEGTGWPQRAPKRFTGNAEGLDVQAPDAILSYSLADAQIEAA